MTTINPLSLSTKIATRLTSEVARARSADAYERAVLAAESPIADNDEDVGAFRLAFLRQWHTHDHVVVRGAPNLADGVGMVALARLLRARFKPYRGDRIAKHFAMSPWTEQLSHTMQAGQFHTDLNTAPTPPCVTVIQCAVSDPTEGAGESRVARWADVHRMLGQKHPDTLKFMTGAEVVMVDDRSAGEWRGHLGDACGVRFHPETIRAASRRLGGPIADIETHLQTVQEVAMEVSEPIHLDPGDTLFVSNIRALHYRGACTVRFIAYPRKFISREVYVAHLRDEPS